MTRLLHVCIGAALLVMTTVTGARAPTNVQLIQSQYVLAFDIPAQALAESLRAVGKRTDINILIDLNMVGGLQAHALKARLTADRAIAQLLVGTGIKHRFIDDHTVVLSRSERAAEGAAAQRMESRARLDRLAQSQNLLSDSGPDIATAADSGDSGAEKKSAVAEVVVTGTHIISNGNNQPTPVTVMSASDLLTATPQSVASALVEMPAFKDSVSPATGGPAAQAGHTYLNLRSLGVARNLVLLDGRRFVSTTDGGAPDINLFPQQLLKRVEVVTGGASAAYGSDAVAGVTNFVLDNDFTGVKTSLSGGTSIYGDADTVRFSIAGGQKFFGGRLRVVASLDYTNSSGAIGPGNGGPDRPWNTAARFLINNPNVTATNPASPSNPSLIVGQNVRSPLSTFGGLISSGPLKGIMFGPGGVPEVFHYGTQLTSNAMVGGDGANTASNATLVTPLNNRVFFSHAALELTDNVTAYIEGNFAKTRVHLITGPAAGASDRSAFQIYADNAFLPASIRQQMANLHLASFPLGRTNFDFGSYNKTVETETGRAVLGLKGSFGADWTWDVYYQHGQNRGTFVGLNGVNVPNMYNAADAVVNPANGAIVCRTTLAHPDNGCVPVNLFGVGSPSPEALSYIHAEPQAIEVVREEVASASLQGSPFSNWAGEVKTAAGYEFRREGVKQTVSPLAQVIINAGDIRGFPAARNNTQGVYALGTSNPVNGHYYDNEVYGEVSVPLLANVFLAKSLDLNAAYRFTDYSSVGNVNTWKVGLTYSPFDDLRLRGTYSRDARAPNIGELYLAQAQTAQTVRDPTLNDAPAGAQIITPGNPDLKAETANTITYGFVYQPHWLRSFSAALDVFSINISNAIGRLGSQTTVTQCYQGNQALCSLITRVDGQITQISLPTLNLSQLAERGIDLEANYQMDMQDLSHLLKGSLRLRALTTYVYRNTFTTPGSPTIDSAAETPTIVNLIAAYDLGGFETFVQGRYLGRRVIDVTYTPSMVADNHIKAYWYADLTLSYRPDVKWASDLQLFGTINNVFNKQPPTGVVTNSGTGTVTDNAAYDLIGRVYTLGLRMTF